MTIFIRESTVLPERHDFDFYATPPGFARAALAQLPNWFKPRCILDPGAGTGVWGRAARERWHGSLITGVEIRDVARPAAYNFWFNNGFQHVIQKAPCFDLVIGNPPFKDAEMFVQGALAMLEDYGFLMYLLRLNFVAGQDRFAELWCGNTPLKKVIVAPKRINFTGDSNPHDHALFVWQKGYVGETSLGWMLHEDNAPEVAKGDYAAHVPTLTTMPLFAEAI